MKRRSANAETNLNSKLAISVTATAPQNNPFCSMHPGFDHEEYHPYHQPGESGMIMDMQHPILLEQAASSSVMETKESIVEEYENLPEMKRKRLNAKQWETLEKNFQEEVKLKPSKKMFLARELNLEPRQIAVWFQNRRARWKNRQLEKMYIELKREFDAVNSEKQNLQEEVLKLQAIIKTQGLRFKQFSTAYTEFSSNETVDDTTVVAQQPPPASTFQYNGGAYNYFQSLYGFHSPAALASSYWSSQLPLDPSI